MSIQVISWALNQAPVTAPVHVLILVAMAERCNDDGTESRQSVKTIAKKARVSPRTVQRELKTLEQMGVVRRGDQSKNEQAGIPGNRRPVVYDLAIELRQDNMSPQNEEESEEIGVTSTANSGVTADSGVTSEPLRGDIDATQGRHGCRTNSPITSPITSSSEVPLQCEHGYDPTDCALCLNVPSMSRRRKAWQPSAQALATAKERVRLTDIGLSIASYEVWKARHKQEPESGEWLTWLLRDEKEAVKEQREKLAAKRKHRTWAEVDD